MDESNLTIAEYVELLEKRASRRGELFDWRTANYFNIEEDDPLAYEYEEPFPGIVLDNKPPPKLFLTCLQSESAFQGYT